MMQFNIKEMNPVRMMELAGQAVTVVCFIYGMFKKGFIALEHKLNKIITDNVNRGVKEMKEYTDTKFQMHESAAFSRIDILESKFSGSK